jgi:hypothetical protein
MFASIANPKAAESIAQSVAQNLSLRRPSRLLPKGARRWLVTPQSECIALQQQKLWRDSLRIPEPSRFLFLGPGKRSIFSALIGPMRRNLAALLTSKGG